jgi:hypothetical protein
VAFDAVESGRLPRASLFGAKRVWFPVLRAVSSLEIVVLSKEARRSARVVRLLLLKALRRPVTYDDWASVEVASAETRRILVNMAVDCEFVSGEKWAGDGRGRTRTRD